RRIQPGVPEQFVHGVEPGDVTDFSQPGGHRLSSHAGNALEVRPQLAPGSRPTRADSPGQSIRVFYTQRFYNLDLLIQCVDPFPALIEHEDHPCRDSRIREVIAVNRHGTIRTEILNQRTNNGPVDLPQLPDRMAKAEQITVDPVGEPTALRHQFGTLVG